MDSPVELLLFLTPLCFWDLRYQRTSAGSLRIRTDAENNARPLWTFSGFAIASRVLAQKKGTQRTGWISVAACSTISVSYFWCLNSKKNMKPRWMKPGQKTFLYLKRKKFIQCHPCQCGSWLAEKWCFPRNLIEVIDFIIAPRWPKMPQWKQNSTYGWYFSSCPWFRLCREISGAGSSPAAFELLNLSAAISKMYWRYWKTIWNPPKKSPDDV